MWHWRSGLNTAMPELVDVEGFRRVAEQAVGRRIRAVTVHDPQVLRDVTPRGLARALRGQRFASPWRHGKWLVLPTVRSGSEVLVHFGMTGALLWCPDNGQRHRHDRVEFAMDGGTLRYRDQRKLTGLRLVSDEAARADVLGDLGPDALSVSRALLRERLSGRRGRLKSALLDQHVIAGLGNLLTDEILWQARLHPCTSECAPSCERGSGRAGYPSGTPG
jgi:formamidopyrimidine-DNA glycosylase